MWRATLKRRRPFVFPVWAASQLTLPHLPTRQIPRRNALFNMSGGSDHSIAFIPRICPCIEHPYPPYARNRSGDFPSSINVGLSTDQNELPAPDAKLIRSAHSSRRKLWRELNTAQPFRPNDGDPWLLGLSG